MNTILKCCCESEGMQQREEYKLDNLVGNVHRNIAKILLQIGSRRIWAKLLNPHGCFCQTRQFWIHYGNHLRERERKQGKLSNQTWRKQITTWIKSYWIISLESYNLEAYVQVEEEGNGYSVSLGTFSMHFLGSKVQTVLFKSFRG